MIFAVTSVVSWSQYGLICIRYFSFPNGELIYKLLFIFLIPLGVFLSPGLVWNLCDIFNALMIFPNMISVLILYPVINKIIKNYENKV
jgi:AGCS family alanine or glycine:cation symporter